MAKQVQTVVYVVTTYNSVTGVYESADDASRVVKERISKGVLCSMHCMPLIQSSKPNVSLKS